MSLRAALYLRKSTEQKGVEAGPNPGQEVA
jgi:hypothetical protein